MRRVGVEEDGPCPGCYRHHSCYQALNATTCNSPQIPHTSLFLRRAPTHRGCEESTSSSRFGSTTLPDRTLKFRRIERPRSADDLVDLVRAVQALGGERGCGGVEKGVAGAAEDKESMSTGKGVFNSRRLSWLCHRSKRGLSRVTRGGCLLRLEILWSVEETSW